MNRAPTNTDQERVYTMPESRVYHLRSDCPALNRSNRYYSVKSETREEARRHYYPKDRPCRICGVPAS